MSANKETFSEKLTRLAGEYSAEMAHKHMVSVYLNLRGDQDIEPQSFVDLLAHHRTLIDAIEPVPARYFDLVYMSRQLDWWYGCLPDKTKRDQTNPVMDASFALLDKFIALDNLNQVRICDFLLDRIDRYRPYKMTAKEREERINAPVADRLARIMTIAEKSDTSFSTGVAQETYERACQFFDKSDARRLALQERYVNHCVAVNESKPLIHAVNMLVEPLLQNSSYQDDKEHFVYAASSLDKLATALLDSAHHQNPYALQACGDALDLLLMNHIQAYYVNPRRSALLDKYKQQKDQLDILCNKYSMLPSSELERIERDLLGPEDYYLRNLQENEQDIGDDPDDEEGGYSPSDWPKPLLN